MYNFDGFTKMFQLKFRANLSSDLNLNQDLEWPQAWAQKNAGSLHPGSDWVSVISKQGTIHQGLTVL